jgi:aspartate racemase
MDMKTLGIIGGIGPESTIDYYRLTVATYREQKADGSYPSVVINSIDLNTVRNLVEKGQLTKLAEYLVAELQKLARAGAHLGLLAANTPHIVFDDEVQQQSPIPLISIVQATCDAANTLGLNRLGLFGTSFTMQGRFYPDVFSRQGITLIVPDQGEQAYIHDKYMNELVNGIFLPETRNHLMAIGQSLKDRHHIEGLILGGTELPLILRDSDAGIPLLDTARIHVQVAVAKLLS